MAISNKERQRQYRERKRLENLELQERSAPHTENTYKDREELKIPSDLAKTITRICSFKGISEVQFLEKIVCEEERCLLQDIWSDPEAKKRYFGWD